MVRLVIKRADVAQFLIEVPGSTSIDELITLVCEIYNGYLKIGRICAEIDELSKHGVTLPPNMQGLTEDQIVDLKLKDEWGDKCIPSGGYIECKDEIGRRNGRGFYRLKQNEFGVDLLLFVQRATGFSSLEIMPTEADISHGYEDASQEVILIEDATLWFSGKEMLRGKLISDYVGRNEKTKIVAKLSKRGAGAPAREPVMDEKQQRALMAHYYRKQEEWKKLEANDEDSYLDSAWAEPGQLKRQFHGLTNIKWGPR
ncbi:uncharacterized protein DEA37_0000289 [Paragonimus westermani]|uniref:Uncharacterized protein n=1 Tax=Paragonimus westermani TaxID=34504 RepID=A0A5J4NWL9_9TREM|nr:uncharacterized protein DEA37_0000289 [Paragonimus westermani]